MLKGGCFCGEVRYEAGGEPFHETVCHCGICRGTTGAPFVQWFSVPRAAFRLVKGQPTRFHSSEKAVRTFCPSCGTQLTFERTDFGEETDVTTASLDDANALPPRDHVWVERRLAWIKPDGRPEFARGRTGR